MKLVAVLFSFHILCLTLAPPALSMKALFFLTNSSKKSCCAANNNQQVPQHEQQGDCCGGICNPFMSCCNVHILLSNSLSLSAPFDYFIRKFDKLSENDLSDYIADTWHPPKSWLI